MYLIDILVVSNNEKYCHELLAERSSGHARPDIASFVRTMTTELLVEPLAKVLYTKLLSCQGVDNDQ